MLQELPFYDELSTGKIWKAFKICARSYRIEIIDSKDWPFQWTASKLSTRYLFEDSLDEMKGFRYQITAKVLLRKYKEYGETYAPVYLNSNTKAVINSKYMLDKSFQEILYKIENWINEGSGWVKMENRSIFIFTVHYHEVHALKCLIN